MSMTTRQRQKCSSAAWGRSFQGRRIAGQNIVEAFRNDDTIDTPRTIRLLTRDTIDEDGAC